MVRNRQSKTLLHFVERLIFSQWILNLVVTGFEPTTIRFADGSINRHAIRPVGPRQKPFSSTSEEDPKIAKRTSLNRQFLGQVAGGRAGPGRVADCVFLQRSNFRAASRQKTKLEKKDIQRQSSNDETKMEGLDQGDMLTSHSHRGCCSKLAFIATA